MRRWLDLDAGYLSRILTRFEADGLVRRSRSPGDGRRQVIALTQTGRAVFGRLDALSSEQIRGLLGPIPPGRRDRLTAAMAGIREILSGTPGANTVVLRPPVPGDIGWVVQRNGALYAAEYGWDETYEALVARIVADYAGRADAAGEAAWIAEVAGERAGCAFVHAAPTFEPLACMGGRDGRGSGGTGVPRGRRSVRDPRGPLSAGDLQPDAPHDGELGGRPRADAGRVRQDLERPERVRCALALLQLDLPDCDSRLPEPPA